ncbi:MAG: dephospho-CoA kinase [Candidatus Nanopelagicales bacterium]|jgi:dephospho-CoA kinase|nr:dephospho-CoA kinase [Candidatus Nanopelagicales bacterium]
MALRVGLTGGIGSGKSTVAGMLADRGAVVVDADAIARALVEPGQPALAEIVARFGPGVLRADGTLDRAGLAALVFPDPEALAALDAIMHPRIAARSAELLARAEAAGAPVVVYDMPLLVEQGLAGGFDVVLVVLAAPDVRLRRLADRGIPAADATERMARQASDEQRRAAADLVIENDGDLAALAEQVQRAWEAIVARAG